MCIYMCACTYVCGCMHVCMRAYVCVYVCLCVKAQRGPTTRKNFLIRKTAQIKCVPRANSDLSMQLLNHSQMTKLKKKKLVENQVLKINSAVMYHGVKDSSTQVCFLQQPEEAAEGEI